MGVAKRIEFVFDALPRNKTLRLICAFALAAALVPAVASSARADEDEPADVSGGYIESSLDTYAFDKHPAVADTEERCATYNISTYYSPGDAEADSFYDCPEDKRSSDDCFTVSSSNEAVASIKPSAGGYGFDLTFPSAGEATITISYSYGEFSATKSYVVKVVEEENPATFITLDESLISIDVVECPICDEVHEAYVSVDYELTAENAETPITYFELWTEPSDEDVFAFGSEEGKLIVGTCSALEEPETIVVKVGFGGIAWTTANLVVSTTSAERTVESMNRVLEIGSHYTPLCSSASDEGSCAPFIFNEAFESANAWHTGVADALVGSVVSSNPGVVGVFGYSIPAGDGVVVYFLEAKQSGTSTVTMTDILGNSYTALITVPDDSVPATSVALSVAKAAMKAGETQALTATVEPSGSTDIVAWSSSDESVLKVDQNGIVEAVGNGCATVTAQAGTASATTGSIIVTTELKGLSFGVESLSLNVGGESSQLTPVFTPSTASNKNVTWSSSAPSVATVDGNGLVTPVSVGGATITATSAENGSLVAQCIVVVSQPVEGIALDKSEVSLVGKDSVQLVATVLPADASNKDVTWSSSEPSVATVEDGLVTSVSEGEATITAKSADGSHYAECTVFVSNKLAGVEVSPYALSMVKGDKASVSFVYTGELPGAVISTFGWSAKDGLEYRDGVFVDSSTGDPVCKMEKVRDGENEIGATFEALGTGSGVIELEFEGGFTRELRVSVSNPARVVSVSSSAKTLEVGEDFELSATVSPEDADDAAVSWSSSNKAVATVDENGKVEAVSAGKAVVAATTSNGKSAQCVVTVEAVDVISTASSSNIEASVEASSKEELEIVNGIIGSLAGDDGAEVELVVEASDDPSEEVVSAVEKIQADGKMVAAVVDARFEVNGEEVEFNTEGKEVITVKIAMTDEMKALDPETIVVVYISEDGEIEEMPTWVSGDYLYFKTTHFSTYAVTGSLPVADASEGSDSSDSSSPDEAEVAIAATGDSVYVIAVALGVSAAFAAAALVLVRRRMA